MDINSAFTLAAQAVGYGAGAIAAAGFIKSFIFTVPQKHEALITTFGKHTRTEKEAGLHVKWPWPINVVEEMVETTLQQVGQELETKTKDDLFVDLPISIQYEIADTGKYHFNNNKPVDQIKTLVSAAVRKYTSGKNFQELYNERDEISEEVIREVSSQMKDYGVDLRRIVIDEPKAPPQVQESFNKVRASERLVEAARNEASAHKIGIIAEAEAHKERDILRGEGAAGYRARIFEQYGEQIKALEDMKVERSEAVQVMLRVMEMDTQREVASHGNMVIYSNTAPKDNVDPADLIALLKGMGIEPNIPKPQGRAPSEMKPAIS